MANKNGRPKGTIKGMSKKQMIREIAQACHVKESVAKNMLDYFSDMFIRETVLNGEFTLVNCFSVTEHTRRQRKVYNINKGKYEIYPKTTVLSMRLSAKINNWHSWKNRNQRNEEMGLTVEDWRTGKAQRILAEQDGWQEDKEPDEA